MCEEIIKEEYKAKWQYVIHTEILQMKYVEWYFGIVAAMLVFIYSKKSSDVLNLVGGVWVPLIFLVMYSIFTNVRLLAQKSNYDTYTKRLREIDKTPNDNRSIMTRSITTFKIQYYTTVLAGTIVFLVFLIEKIGHNCLVAVIATILYFLVMILLSFTPLIAKTNSK